MEATIEVETATESESEEPITNRSWKFWPAVPKHLPRLRTTPNRVKFTFLPTKGQSNQVPSNINNKTAQVKEIINPGQRLRRLEFISQKNWRLDEQTDYSQSLIDKKNDLCQYVRDPSHDSPAAKAARHLIVKYRAFFDLVSVYRPDLKRSVTYIRVSGVPEDRIRELHAALSKKEFCRLYKKLFLCYDTNPVSRLASKDSRLGMKISDLTLCGRIAIFKDGKGYQTRTIACLLETVPSKSSDDHGCYALTAFHSSQAASEDSSSEVSLDELLEDESTFDPDVSSALIVNKAITPSTTTPSTIAGNGGNSGGSDLSISPIGSTDTVLGTTTFPLNDVQTGKEWSLIRIGDPLFRLPNAVLLPTVETGPDLDDMEPCYLNYNGIAKKPAAAEAVVVAGVSGRHKAQLLPRSIQIDFEGSGLIEAWIIQFPATCPLVKGDSGSLVIDAKTHVAYGYVFASTGDRALLRPLHHAISEIQKQTKSEVRLPSPFKCLAEVSRHYPKTGSSASTAELYALEAISDRALRASPDTQTIQAYRQKAKDPLNRTTLAWLVAKTGHDAFSTAVKDVNFWEDARQMRDKNPQFDYNLLRSLFPKEAPKVEKASPTAIAQDQKGQPSAAQQTSTSAAVGTSVPVETNTHTRRFRVMKIPRQLPKTELRKRINRAARSAFRATQNSSANLTNAADNDANGIYSRNTAFDQDSELHSTLLKLIDESRLEWAVLLSGFAGFFTSAYQLLSSSLTQPLINMVYYYPGHLSTGKVVLLRVSMLLGMFLGQLLFGFFADLYGRKPLYTFQLFILTLATCGVAMASRGEAYSTSMFGWLVSWRLVMGIGIGAEYPFSALLAAEFTPSRLRTRILSLVFLAQPVGYLMAALVTYLVLLRYEEQIPSAADDRTCNHNCRLSLDRSWRVIIATSLIPAFISYFLRQRLPESPLYTAFVLNKPDKAISDVREGFKFRRRRRTQSEELAIHLQDIEAGSESLGNPPNYSNSSEMPNQNSRRMHHADPERRKPSIWSRRDEPERGIPSKPKSSKHDSFTSSSEDRFRAYWSGLHKYLIREEQWPKLLGVSLAWMFFGSAYYPLVQLVATTISGKLFRQVSFDTGCTFQNGTSLSTWPTQFDVAPNCTDLASLSKGVDVPSLRAGITSYPSQVMLILCLGLILGGIYTVVLTKRTSPRQGQTSAFLVTSLILFLAGILFVFSTLTESAAANIFLFGVVTIAFGITGAYIFTIPAELFTTKYRAFCYGIAAASGQVGAIVMQVALQYISFDGKSRHTSSETGTIWLGYTLISLSSFTIAGSVVTWLCIPETTRWYSGRREFKRLDQLEHAEIPKRGRALLLRRKRREDD